MADHSAPNVFEQPYAVVQNVEQIVGDRILDARETSDALQTVALSTILALRDTQFEFGDGGLPGPPDIDSTIEVNIDLTPVTPTSFGTITSEAPADPTLDGMENVAPLDIGPFVPSISGLNIPNAPDPRDLGPTPELPEFDDIELPSKPGYTLPNEPELVLIEIPEFEGINLDPFDVDPPEFDEQPPDTNLQWSEATYHPEIMTEVLVIIRRLWAGGSGIPEAVEQAMFERASSREDMTANREIDAVAGEFSLRGFTSPTGMQAARTDQMRQDLALKKMGLNRELTIKIAEWQIENIRFGVQQAIAAENVYVNIFLNAAQRIFEAAKFRVETLMNIYNAQVSLFNTKMIAFQVSAQLYEIKLKTELAKLEVFKAEIEAEIAKGQINEQRVRAYTAQVQAIGTVIEIYKAEMQGASVQADVIRNRIEGYKAEVQAYAERVNADKLRYDAYESQIKGELGKASIIDSEARSYAALVSGKSAIAEVDIKRAELTIQKNKVLIEGYIAALESEKTRISSQTAVIDAGARAYIADTQRFSAQASAETTKAQITVSAKETELRTNVSFYSAQVQAYIGNMEQMIRKASLVVDSLKAAGQISSTLAAGAMAGVHVGATLSGQGGVSASGSLSESWQHSDSKSESKSESISYDGGKV